MYNATKSLVDKNSHTVRIHAHVRHHTGVREEHMHCMFAGTYMLRVRMCSICARTKKHNIKMCLFHAEIVNLNASTMS